MSPPYIFKIDEIKENPAEAELCTSDGHWMPSTMANANILAGGGVSGIHWFCNGQQMQQASHGQVPLGAVLYSVYSIYFCAGYGFWVLRGDGMHPPLDEAWAPLRFEHDERNFSSYLTNAGPAQSLRCQRPDQQWPKMLLPDIYHTRPSPTHAQYGGLKGDLAIFLGLIAFSMSRENLQQYLASMFSGSSWRVHGLPNGREDRRGVVVSVYTCPPTWASNSTMNELRRYEDGLYMNYYN